MTGAVQAARIGRQTKIPHLPKSASRRGSGARAVAVLDLNARGHCWTETSKLL